MAAPDMSGMSAMADHWVKMQKLPPKEAIKGCPNFRRIPGYKVKFDFFSFIFLILIFLRIFILILVLTSVQSVSRRWSSSMLFIPHFHLLLILFSSSHSTHSHPFPNIHP